MDDDIAGWFDARAELVARDIERLVAIRSVSSDRVEAHRALDSVLATARSFGLSTRLAASGLVGIAELACDSSPEDGTEPETLGILAHVDVVDAGDPASWSHDPWGEIADGSVWGRGCVDDKGPLMVCLWALRSLRELGRPFRKNVMVVIGTMEEIAWDDMRALKAEGAPLPDYGFTPDGAFPVVNKEKGYCDVTLSFPRDRHAGLGDWRVLGLEGGEALNAVPARASARLEAIGPGATLEALASARDAFTCESRISFEAAGDGRFSVVSRGVVAHSCYPDKGVNAIVALAGFMSRLGPNAMAACIADELGGDYLARGIGLQTRPETVDGEYFGPTTESPDLLTTTEDRFELTLNLRLGFGQTLDEVLGAFEAAGRRYGFEARVDGAYMPALFVPKDRPYIKALMAAYERRTGLPGSFALDPGTSYAKAMPGVVAFGPVFPGAPDLCHEADERLSLDDIRLLGKIYADAIASIVGSTEPMAGVRA